MSAGSCGVYTTRKYGKAEIDLTGTDFRLPTTIPYEIRGWPACAKVLLDPTMSVDRKKWSVRCGGHCGFCIPAFLVLEVDGC